MDATKRRCLTLFATLLLSSAAQAQPHNTDKDFWGIGLGLRSASIPFKADQDTVQDITPLFFFDNDYVYLDGLEGGVKLLNSESDRISALGRYRFFDIPEQFQNQVRADQFDMGLQWRHQWQGYWRTDVEALADRHGRFHANLTVAKPLGDDNFWIEPWATLRYKSDQFNDAYYGLDQYQPGAGVDFTAGAEGRYHLWSDVYLLGRLQVRYLDSAVSDLPISSGDWQGEGFIGIGLFQRDDRSQPRPLPSGHYLRLAHGWATPSNLSDIIRFASEKDEYNNQLTSVFYGYPLTNSLFDLPLDLYLTPGLVYHHKSDVQNRSGEYVVAFKGYYNFKWPVKWRIGLAEGLSYVDSVTYIEQTEMDEKGYRASKLLNYLDFSFDVELGDLTGWQLLNDYWLGYSIHHRSGIFESSSQFGRIKGGSNYNTIYIQRHF